MGTLLALSGDPISVDRAALIVRRGWVPAAYREKSSRPSEVNSRELVRLTGCFMPSKDVHDYKIPNNPDANDWHNLCCEDLGIYWDLPNTDEQKYYYFHSVNLDGQNSKNRDTTPVQVDSIDEVVNEYYKWNWTEKTHKQVFVPFGVASAVSLGIAFLAI